MDTKAIPRPMKATDAVDVTPIIMSIIPIGRKAALGLLRKKV